MNGQPVSVSSTRSRVRSWMSAFFQRFRYLLLNGRNFCEKCFSTIVRKRIVVGSNPWSSAQQTCPLPNSRGGPFATRANWCRCPICKRDRAQLRKIALGKKNHNTNIKICDSSAVRVYSYEYINTSQYCDPFKF